MTTASEALDAAADLIEQNGWCRGRYTRRRNGVACFCAEGALRAALGGQIGSAEIVDYPPDEKNRRTYYSALHLLFRELGFSASVSGGVAGWNDAQHDKRKVVRALRRTARKARSTES